MNTKPLDAIVLRYLGYGLLFLAGIYLLYLIRGTIPLFLIGLLLAYALDPIVKRLQQKGYSRPMAVGFLFLIFLLIMLCLVGLLASAWQQAQTLLQNWPQYQQNITETVQKLLGRVDQMHLPFDVKKTLNEQANEVQTRLPQLAGARWQNALNWILGSAGAILIGVVVMPLITMWMMLEMNNLRARALMLVPPANRRDVVEIGQSINEMLGRYVRGQMIVCGSYGVLCTIGFVILSKVYGMQYPLVLGLLAGIVYIIPYLGMAMIATAAALSGYFTSSAPVPCALAALGICLGLNLVMDYGVAPRILGKGVGLHPLMIIFALLSGAQLGGIPGMILAVPLFASLRVILIYIFPKMSAPIPDEIMNPNGEKSTPAQVTARVGEVERAMEKEAGTDGVASTKPTVEI